MMDQARKLRDLVQSTPGPERRNVPVADQQKRSASAPSRPQVRSACRTVAVTSGKGGVGKTNIALMLTIALANLGKKTLLLDADLGLANIHILLGLAPRRHLGDLADGTCTLDDVICTGPSGIHIIPGASGLETLANIEPLKLEQLRRSLNTLESRYDYIIIDTGAGIGRVTTEFAGNADATIVVMTTEPTSLADAYAMLKVLNDKKDRQLSVLINMAATDADGREAFDRLNTLVVKFLERSVDLSGVILYDPEIAKMVRRQKVTIVERPNHVISQRVNSLARRLCGMPVPKHQGFFSRLFSS